eukprot:848558-Alexandrium_andersonii.AAC.1
MAFYGVQTSHVPVRAKQRLQTACSDALLGRRDDLRSPELVLSFAGFGLASVDGMIAIERVKCMRR